jgi:hypothetical protein
MAYSYPVRFSKLTVKEFNQMKLVVEGKIAEQYKDPIKPKFAKLPTLKASGWNLFHCADRVAESH